MLFSLASFSKQAYEKNIVSSFFIVDAHLTGSFRWVLNLIERGKVKVRN